MLRITRKYSQLALRACSLQRIILLTKTNYANKKANLTSLSQCKSLLYTSKVWKVSKDRAFSGPYFPVIGLNTEIEEVSLRIQPE